MCKHLFLGSQFYSIYVGFYASTILFRLLQIWNIVLWNQEMEVWCLQLCLLSGVALAIQGLWWFQLYLRIVCSMSVTNAIWILIGILLYLWMALGNTNTLTILICLIHEHGIFPFTCVIFSFFSQGLIAFGVENFHLLITFSPKYFFLFDIIVNGIIFFISFLYSLLLV